MTGRVRVMGGPWPERIGCVGVIVANPHPGRVYPWAGLGDSEVIVLLDDDPLDCPTGVTRTWSCVYYRANLEPE